MTDLFGLPAVGPRQAEARDPCLSQWFTPFWAAEELVHDALSGYGDVRVIEPSCGTGSFLSAIPERLEAYGVEIDPALARKAASASGREVLVGDYRRIDLAARPYEVVIGNPPFDVATIEAFLERAHGDLPEDGMIAMILPAYAFQTPSRVTRWMERFSIDVSIVPRTLFPNLSKPLVWAKYVKTARRRFTGMLLFSQAREISKMRPAVRHALDGPGTWRQAVSEALRSLGGSAPLSAIYDAMAPERRSGGHWREKVRQTLQRNFVTLGAARWSLPA